MTNIGLFAPPQTSLWGWYFVDGGAYTETSGTPSSLITTDATNIGSLLDQSGNSRHLYQATAANQPVFNTNKINGMAAGTFLNDVLVSTDTGFAASAAEPHTVYVVVFPNTWTDISTIFSASIDDSPTFGLIQHTATPKVAVYNGGYQSGGGISLSLSAWHLLFGTCTSSTAANSRADAGASDTTTTAGTGSVAVANVALGALDQIPQFTFDGVIAEAILYKNVAHNPDSGDGLKTRQYLNSKYNLGLGI